MKVCEHWGTACRGNNPDRTGRDGEILLDKDAFKQRHTNVKGHSKFRKWQGIQGTVKGMGLVGGWRSKCLGQTVTIYILFYSPIENY